MQLDKASFPRVVLPGFLASPFHTSSTIWIPRLGIHRLLTFDHPFIHLIPVVVGARWRDKEPGAHQVLNKLGRFSLSCRYLIFHNKTTFLWWASSLISQESSDHRPGPSRSFPEQSLGKFDGSAEITGCRLGRIGHLNISLSNLEFQSPH